MVHLLAPEPTAGSLMEDRNPLVQFPAAANLRAAMVRLAKEKTHDAALAVQSAKADIKAFRSANLKLVN
jgi:hypothetical protein